MNARRSDKSELLARLGVVSPSDGERTILNDEAFRRMLSLERKRSERSRKTFLLMLVDPGCKRPSGKDAKVLETVMSALSRSIRETDLVGWYRDQSVVGVMFTETGHGERHTSFDPVIERVKQLLRSDLAPEQFSRISFSFHVFPEDWKELDRPRDGNQALYPEVMQRDGAQKFSFGMKRATDILVSAIALLFLAPVFLAIAAAIKITSAGPVFFRQRRIGQYGRPFLMMKFRSMRANSDISAHKEYAGQWIAGVANKNPSGDGAGVFKLTSDSRITKVGALLRRSSLDELPQLINVLRGDMSLVGPRPPIDYEVEKYDVWHRRRLMEVKPGITGLWQVAGRNRIPFDEMVRLDLIYAQSCSPWLDLKILLQTPKAVIEGAH